MTAATAEVAFATRDDYIATVERYRDDGFVMCVDVCAVDYLTHPGRTLPEGIAPERFEIVVNLVSFEPPRRERIRIFAI